MSKVMEIKRTMLSKSIREEENTNRLMYMVPASVPGRHQILTKLKDLTVSISAVEVIPIHALPSVISNVIPFFSTDGFYESNFIAYGTCTDGKEKLLWDDVIVDDMKHDNHTVDVSYIKDRFVYNKDVAIVTCRENKDMNILSIYYYTA